MVHSYVNLVDREERDDEGEEEEAESQGGRGRVTAGGGGGGGVTANSWPEPAAVDEDNEESTIFSEISKIFLRCARSFLAILTPSFPQLFRVNAGHPSHLSKELILTEPIGCGRLARCVQLNKHSMKQEREGDRATHSLGTSTFSSESRDC